MYAKILGERWVLSRNGFIHGVGDIAVGDVARRGSAEFGDVDGFGEVHFEEGALAIG